MTSLIGYFITISFAINIYFIAAEKVSSLTQVCFTNYSGEMSDLKLHLGARSFLEFVQSNDIIVDKSLLLKKVFSPDAPKVTLLTAPYKWGKTINLDMITFFAHTEFHGNGMERVRENTAAYKYFTKGDKSDYQLNFNKAPLISQDGDFIEKYSKRYLVLKVDLSSINVKDKYDALSYDAFHSSFHEAIKHTLAQNTFIRNVVNAQKPDDTDGQDEMENYRRMLENWENAENGIADLTKTIHHVCEMIRYKSPTKSYDHTLEKKDILLIVDQYDKPFNDIYFHLEANSKDDEALRIRKFMCSFFKQTFHANKYFNQAIITGITRNEGIANTSESSSESDISKNALEEILSMNFDNSLFPFYGYTRKEVKKLLELYGLPDYYEEVKNTYKGYNSIDHPNDLLYNPLNVMKFIKNKMLEMHEKSTSTNESIDDESTNEPNY